MATVWLARERKSGRECIIKTPRRGTVMDHIYLDKLIQEAKCLKKLEHQSIVRYMDDFYYRDEYHLVLEYLHGETLMTSSPRVAYEEEQVVAWACQMLEALSYLHKGGLVHRDINPKNIMLCADGSVKLIDFGTAKKMGEISRDAMGHEAFTQITNRGFDIPELFTGEPSDQRCDLCGLAQTCIYLLTLGQPNEICSGLFKYSWPRTFGEASLLVNHLTAAGVSQRTARCLAQAVMFSPGHRFADAHAMLAALSTVEGFPIKPSEVMVPVP
jgi:serine/threonine-protein kinase